MKTDNKKHILYISYDGMTDPLGQSQVLPYIIGLSNRGYRFTLLSAEKKERFEKFRSVIQEVCDNNNITWVTVPFTTSPPLLSKIIDVQKLTDAAVKLCKENNFGLVHCRSYISAGIGLQLKQKAGLKFLFDMRGFWVDERVEGGIWNLNNPFYKLMYRIYKKKEGRYIAGSDQIISLTDAGKNEIQNWASYKNNPITVIPCSADFDLFSLVSEEEKDASKIKYGFANDDYVVSYLGSIGTWYMLEEMLVFFKKLKMQYKNAKFLFITPDNPQIIKNKVKKLELNESDIKITFAPRKEVRSWIASSDVSLSFIKQSYSKIASSPTKLGELLAMGIPVVCNSSVGDVAQIIQRTGGGIVIDEFTNSEYETAISKLPSLQLLNRNEIRENAYVYYNLNRAIDEYEKCYKRLLAEE